MESKDRISKIREQIRTGNPARVMEAVRICRDQEEPDILAELVRVLAQSPAPSVRQAILGLFSDLSHPSAVPVLARTIKENKRHPDLQAILSSLWQSRLVFHEHLALMIDLIIEQNYMVALEAFTIIENSLEQIPEDMRKTGILRLEQELSVMDADKQKLVSEMIRGLQTIG